MGTSQSNRVRWKEGIEVKWSKRIKVNRIREHLMKDWKGRSQGSHHVDKKPTRTSVQMLQVDSEGKHGKKQVQRNSKM